MKNILLLSSIYSNGGVIYKYVSFFAQALAEYANVTIATARAKVQAPHGCNLLTAWVIPSKLYLYVLHKILKRECNALPDIYHYTISPFLFHRCDKYMKNNKVDLIHSFSFSCSSHIIAYRLKQKHNTPWVAHFMDAWIGNPFRNVKSKDKLKDETYERIVAENADIIIHTNHVIAGQWVKRYGSMVKDKIRILPLSYSPEVEGPIRSNKSYKKEKVTITYIGTCAGDRNYQTLIEAIKEVENVIPNLSCKLQVNMLGNLLDIDKNKIIEYGLDDIFVYIGRKSGEELKQYYEEADIFLVIDAPMKENIFFPSKLLDYFIYQKPILGISPKIGVTNQFLMESGNLCFENKDIHGVRDYVIRAVSDFDSLQRINVDYYKKFLSNELIKQYLEFISNNHSSKH